MMGPEHQGEVDIWKEMRYMEPQVLHDALRKEIQELFLYTEGDYLHIIEKLKVLNRKTMPVNQKKI